MGGDAERSYSCPSVALFVSNPPFAYRSDRVWGGFIHISLSSPTSLFAPFSFRAVNYYAIRKGFVLVRRCASILATCCQCDAIERENKVRVPTSVFYASQT